MSAEDEILRLAREIASMPAPDPLRPSGEERRYAVLVANDDGEPATVDVVTARSFEVGERNALTFYGPQRRPVVSYGAGRWIRAAEVREDLEPVAIETLVITRRQVRHGQPGRPRLPRNTPSPTSPPPGSP